jgi:hypothetical protein
MDSSTGRASDQSPVLHQWTARKLQPVVLLYVAVVFLGFMAVSWFVLHSGTAVKVLAMTAVASIIPLVPSVLHRIEYRIADGRIERRSLRAEQPEEFAPRIGLDEVSHVKRIGHGFKVFKPCDVSGPVVRFVKTHLSDRYSEEIHVEKGDRDRVLAILVEKGIPVR